MATATASAAPTGRHQRSVKNYLLDSHFQLKYTSYLVGIALALSLSLGLVLWRTSSAVIEQSRQTVTQGDKVVGFGREVVKESRKVSAVVRMNIVRDPVYSDNPELLGAFNKDADAQDERLKQQQDQIEQQSAALKQQSADIESQQRIMLISLFGLLTALVVFIGIAGIMVTHKVAGPIYKMKKQLADVGAGKLGMPAKLRKGDELVHFFETFEAMVASLRQRQEYEIGLLDAAISKIDSKVDEQYVEPLRALRADMKAALD